MKTCTKEDLGKKSLSKNQDKENLPKRRSSRRVTKTPSYIDRGSSAEDESDNDSDEAETRSQHKQFSRRKTEQKKSSAKSKVCRHWLATLTQVHALVAQYDANTEQPCKTATFGNTLRRGNTTVIRRAKSRQHFLPFALTLDKIDLQIPKKLCSLVNSLIK